MRLIIGTIAVIAINSQLALLFHQHVLVNGSAEVDVNLMPAAASADHSPEQHMAALTSDGNDFFDTDQFLPDVAGSSDVESVPIGSGGNVSMGISNRAGKLYNWDEYSGSIDMYETNDYDYGKYTKKGKTRKKRTHAEITCRRNGNVWFHLGCNVR